MAFDLVAESCNPVGIVSGTKRLHRRPTSHFDQRLQVLVSAIANDLSASRDHAQQLMELPKNCVHIRIDIGVVVFEIIENERARPVVNKLRPLIEKRGVIFIRLDNKIFGIAETS